MAHPPQHPVAEEHVVPTGLRAGDDALHAPQQNEPQQSVDGEGDQHDEQKGDPLVDAVHLRRIEAGVVQQGVDPMFYDFLHGFHNGVLQQFPRPFPGAGLPRRP